MVVVAALPNENRRYGRGHTEQDVQQFDVSTGQALAPSLLRDVPHLAYGQPLAHRCVSLAVCAHTILSRRWDTTSTRTTMKKIYWIIAADVINQLGL